MTNNVLKIVRMLCKIAMFFIVIVSLWEEHLYFSRFKIKDVPVYSRLTDINEYIIVLGIMVFCFVLYFGYNIILREKLLLSVDLTLIAITAIFFTLKYTPWFFDIESNVLGYDKLLSNFRITMYAICVAVTILYLFYLISRALYGILIPKKAGTNEPASREQLEEYMENKKVYKLKNIHRRLESAEKISEEEYQKALLETMKAKVELYKNYKKD